MIYRKYETVRIKIF